MNDDNQKIQIAKNFEELHQAPCSMWTDAKDYETDEDRYIAIYDNLMMGVYGDCFGVNAEYDEDGELISEATEYEVQVDQFGATPDSNDVFCFEISCVLSGGSRFIEDNGRFGDW